MLIAKYALLLYNIREKICLQGASAPFWQKSPMFKTINQGSEVSVMSERTVSENNKLWETAEKIAQQVVAEKKAESEEERRKQKKRVIKLVLLLVLIALIIVFASIAWFAQNKSVSADTMAVGVSDGDFELEVQGTKIENKSDFSKADETYTEGEVQNNDENTRQTTGAQGKIMWRKAANADGTYANGLEPNSHGTLTFWVVPKKSGDLDIEFELNIRGFHATYSEPEDPNDEPVLDKLFEIDDSLNGNAQNGLIKANGDPDTELIQTKKDALEYIKGHILFFSDYDSSTGYYSGFLGTGRSIRFGDCIDPSSDPKDKYSTGGAVSVTKGEKYQVTLYWKWANTLEQMVLDDNPMFVSTNTADRTAMFTYLSQIADGVMVNKVFKDLTNSEITTNLGYIQDDTEGSVDSAIRTLTAAYNNADQVIGNNIDYVLIELTAK